MARSMTKMFKIALPDGSVKEMPEGSTPADVAVAIGPGLAKAALAARINGEVRDIMRPFEGDSSLALITSRDEAEALELVRHDYAHILAEAVQNLYPGTQITFGPATDDGFYYDFAPTAEHGPFTEEDLPSIEEEMRRIIAADRPLVREIWTREQVRDFFEQSGEAFKAEWVMGLPEGETITMYRTGEGDSAWIDLCRGPHLASTGKLDPSAFKLTRVSGAYWRGDPSNPMLSRIYGTAWLSKKQLDSYLVRLEEAARRDHRKIGQEMDLFHLQPEAPGSVFWHPKGWIIWRQLEAYMSRRLDASGYQQIKTPQLIDSKLWVQSGHWGKFRENMFVVPDEVPSTEEGKPVITGSADLLALKPMNCPAHIQVFKQGITSYRELPVRFAEYGCCHRNEPHGALHGIMRVRQFTQDDGHIFCTRDQLVDETKRFCALLDLVYRDLGFPDYRVKLSTRPDQRIGTDEEWDRAEADLEQALKETGLDYEILPGEGSFYGPKLEFHLTDAIGRTWQCGTHQLDPQMPQRLGATYIGADGEKHHPLMLHRAILGTFERFIGILIEHYGGEFPVWLTPVQAIVLPIADRHLEYAQSVIARLSAAGVRAEVDDRTESIGRKIRDAELRKIPYMLVVGDREAEQDEVSVREHRAGDTGAVSVQAFTQRVLEEIKTRSTG
jgi:threonyl-tRNA synthetase